MEVAVDVRDKDGKPVRTPSPWVQTERPGIVALLGGLRRGKDAARPWSWAVDASGYFLTSTFLTGLALILMRLASG